MAHSNQILLTVIVIIVAVLIVLWLLQSFKHESKEKHCFGAKPDPVGGIRTKRVGPGLVEICWDETPNAAHYRVFINEVPAIGAHAPQGARKTSVATGRINLRNRPNHPLVACGDSDCCPQECDECVSQSNYSQVVETCDTCITIKTCEPEFCFIVVPYNKCGQAGKCKEIQFAEVDCLVDDLSCWVVSNDCRGLEIKWNCHECCEFVHIYIINATGPPTEISPPEGIPCCEESFTSTRIDCCDELAIQCESRCGLGEMITIIPGCPPTQTDRSPQEILQAQRQVSNRRFGRTARSGRGKVTEFKAKSRSARRRY